jgi:biopolymer transport protein ExbB/TolQ
MLSLMLKMFTTLAISLLVLGVFASTINLSRIVYAQSQQNSAPTAENLIDELNFTETVIQGGKDVYANATTVAEKVGNKTQEIVQAVANKTEETVQRVVNTTEEAVNKTSLFLSNISDTAGKEEVRANATEASKSIRSKTDVTLRTLVTETQDILDNLTESVKQFIDSSK